MSRTYFALTDNMKRAAKELLIRIDLKKTVPVYYNPMTNDCNYVVVHSLTKDYGYHIFRDKKEVIIFALMDTHDKYNQDDMYIFISETASSAFDAFIILSHNINNACNIYMDLSSGSSKEPRVIKFNDIPDLCAYIDFIPTGTLAPIYNSVYGKYDIDDDIAKEKFKKVIENRDIGIVSTISNSMVIFGIIDSVDIDEIHDDETKKYLKERSIPNRVILDTNTLDIIKNKRKINFSGDIKDLIKLCLMELWNNTIYDRLADEVGNQMGNNE